MADVNLRIAEERSSEREIAKLNRELDQMQFKLRQVRREARKTGSQVKKSFSGEAVSKLKAFALQFAGIDALLASARQSFQDIRQIQDDAASRVNRGAPGRRAFAQVANTYEEFQALAELSARGRTEFGLEGSESQQLVFDAKSKGQLHNFDLFASLKQIDFDPLAAVEAVQKVQAAFGGSGAGRTGGGNARQVLNKTLTAAADSPISAGRFAQSASVASASFSAIGGQDEELFALLSVFAETFKTPEQAAEKIKSLSGQLNKKRHLISGAEGLQGLELIRALPGLANEGRLQSESGDTVDLTKFLGEIQANEAITQYVAREGEISRRLKLIEDAERLTDTSEGELTKKFGFIKRDPKAQSALEADRERQRRELGEEDAFGVTTNRANAIVDEFTAENRKMGIPEQLIWLAQKRMGFQRFVEGDAAFVANPSGNTNFIETFGRIVGQAVGVALAEMPEKVAGGVSKGMKDRGPRTMGPSDDLQEKQ
ncbi:MAG: hypothetical protein MI923_20405 [Phycisphaerales bacterium]|nr:hypothetical protein [Phycisphaerales bacterium]